MSESDIAQNGSACMGEAFTQLGYWWEGTIYRADAFPPAKWTNSGNFEFDTLGR